MARFFKSVNKGSVQLDVFYGWDIDVKEWFIDIKMTGFSGGNLTQWFDSEKNYKKTLKNKNFKLFIKGELSLELLHNFVSLDINRDGNSLQLIKFEVIEKNLSKNN